MGWNDISFMGSVSLKRKSVLILLAVLISMQFTAFSQKHSDDAQKGPEVLKYRPVHLFPKNVQNVYKYTDSSEVTRTFTDGTSTSYSRSVTFFFTVKQPGPTEKGFTVVETSIDSVRYWFKEKKAEITWDSQDEMAGGINLPDLKAQTVPLGKYFDMTYSPYGEVAKIEGEKLDEYFDYINKYGKEMTDTVEVFLWKDGASLARLAQITNVRKILFLEEAIEKDSLWKTPLTIQFENINCFDSVEAKITRVQNGETRIEALAKSIRTLPGNYRFYGIKDRLLSVKSTSGGGIYTLDITPRGTIRRAEGSFEIEMLVPIKSDSFTQKIKNHCVWELMGQFKQ